MAEFVLSALIGGASLLAVVVTDLPCQGLRSGTASITLRVTKRAAETPTLSARAVDAILAIPYEWASATTISVRLDGPVPERVFVRDPSQRLSELRTDSDVAVRAPVTFRVLLPVGDATRQVQVRLLATWERGGEETTREALRSTVTFVPR